MKGIMNYCHFPNEDKIQELVKKSWLGHLDTMLEFDEGIDVDSVEELKSKYDAYIKENFPEAQTETTILND